MKWIDITKEKPRPNQKIIILARGSVQVAYFYEGRSLEEVERTGIIEFADQHGGNLVPYRFDSDTGPKGWFGQYVTHWMELPELPDGYGRDK